MEVSDSSFSFQQENSRPKKQQLHHVQLLQNNLKFQNSLKQFLQKDLPVFLIEKNHNFSPIKKIQNQQDENSSLIREKILNYNRKSKSLQELSKKFIEYFQGKPNNLIQLDKITGIMGVERRRIYDVINILESLGVVSKRGKNNYEWRGLCEATRTINLCRNQAEQTSTKDLRVEKSLQYLAFGFLRLFLKWKPALSLEQAAKKLMKQIDEASVKTKIRRLYDIINVFRSLGLVKKTSLGTKKPGYEWTGCEYLQELIMRKQYSDQNTGINQLNSQEGEMGLCSVQFQVKKRKNSLFSPLVLPMFQKKICFQGQARVQISAVDKKEQLLASNLQEESSNLKATESLTTFKKTKSAFSLVIDGQKATIKKNLVKIDQCIQNDGVYREETLRKSKERVILLIYLAVQQSQLQQQWNLILS